MTKRSSRLPQGARRYSAWGMMPVHVNFIHCISGHIVPSRLAPLVSEHALCPGLCFFSLNLVTTLAAMFHTSTTFPSSGLSLAVALKFTIPSGSNEGVAAAVLPTAHYDGQALPSSGQRPPAQGLSQHVDRSQLRDRHRQSVQVHTFRQKVEHATFHRLTEHGHGLGQMTSFDKSIRCRLVGHHIGFDTSFTHPHHDLVHAPLNQADSEWPHCKVRGWFHVAVLCPSCPSELPLRTLARGLQRGSVGNLVCQFKQTRQPRH